MAPLSPSVSRELLPWTDTPTPGVEGREGSTGPGGTTGPCVVAGARVSQSERERRVPSLWTNHDTLRRDVLPMTPLFLTFVTSYSFYSLKFIIWRFPGILFNKIVKVTV